MRASTLLAHVPLLCLASLVSTDAADLRTGAAAFGVAVTHDGALLVSDDANGTIFRVTHKAPR